MTAVAVSVLVPVLNEEQHIREAVARMRSQRLDADFELIFVDGRSTDGTRAILEELRREDERIRILDNAERRTPQGLNIGLRHARGVFVARMDAHTHYPPDYLALGVARLRRGDVEWVSGPQLASGSGVWSRRAALALSSLLGTGGASFRRLMAAETEVDTGFTGMWRRSTLERHGGWDEGFPVDQDFELAARIRAEGGRIVCVPAMAAHYIPRDSLPALARQYWRYGFYKVKTIRAHPRSMRRSHLLPAGLTLSVVAAAAGPRPVRAPARLGLGVYLAAVVQASRGVRGAGDGADVAALPLVFATMHLAYGFGFLAGCLRFGPPVAALAAVARGNR
ncbi:MAG: glycosyltransferase family 2 protein [Thermoleophilaceae bacterium]